MEVLIRLFVSCFLNKDWNKERICCDVKKLKKIKIFCKEVKNEVKKEKVGVNNCENENIVSYWKYFKGNDNIGYIFFGFLNFCLIKDRFNSF